ncbi:TonB-dependent receptor plug domain-containing protein [Pelodictyon luteolum]|nr:TonB-dependent receptor [Pelodictyon luteolum]
MLLALCWILPGTGLAASFLSEETVVTATRTETPVSKVPAAIEVISKEEIAASGAETLDAVLAEAQSISLQSPSGRISIAGLRGLNSKNTLILLDGMRLSSGFGDYVDMEEIPTAMIERIEIIRGSGSALYGSDAIGGVINIITRKPTKELHAGVGFRTGISKYSEAGMARGDGWISGTTGKLGYVIAGSYSDRDHYDRDKSDIVPDGDDKYLGGGSAALTYRFHEGVTARMGVLYHDRQNEGARLYSKKYYDRTLESDRTLGYAGLDIATGSESTLTLQGSLSSYDWKSTMDPITVASGFVTSLKQEASLLESHWVSKLSKSNRLSIGLDYRKEDRRDVNINKTFAVVTGSHDVWNFGSYIQDELSVIDPLGLTLGLRYDSHSDFGTAFSPKVSIWHQLADKLKIRGSYGEGFRAPTIYELYIGSPWTQSQAIVANPDLEPEKSRTYEIGMDATAGPLTCSITGFRNDLRDMIGKISLGMIDGVPNYQLGNIDRAMTQGVEVSASVTIPYGFTLSDEFTTIESEDKSTGADLLFVPDITNTLKLAYLQPKAGINANIRLLTTGRQMTDKTTKTEGYSLVNLYLSKSVISNTSVFFGIDNLFNDEADAAYALNSGAAATGTYFYGGITMSL